MAHESEDDVAYDAGWRAYRSEKTRNDNPYPDNTELNISWLFGWIQGEWDSYMAEET